MGVVVVKADILVLELYALVCFLVLQGSAGYNLSPSPSALPAFSPDGDAALTPVSHGTTFKSSAPTPVSPQNGTFLHPPQASPPLYSAPAPQKIKDPVPSSPPSIILPPNTSVTSPVYSNHTIPVLPPRASNSKPHYGEHPFPEGPAPVASLPRISPHNPAISPSVMPRADPPKSHQNEAPESPTAPVANSHAAKGLPHSQPPMVSPKISPTSPHNPAISPSVMPRADPPKSHQNEAPESPTAPVANSHAAKGLPHSQPPMVSPKISPKSPHNPAISPSVMPRADPPKSHQNEAPESPTAPVSNSHSAKGLPHSQPPMVSPKISPTSPHNPAISPSVMPRADPPKSHQNEAPESPTAPVSNSHAPNKGLPHSPPTMVSPKISPTFPHNPAISPSVMPRADPPKSHQNEAPESPTALVSNSHAPNKGLPHSQPTMVSPKISPTSPHNPAISPSVMPRADPPKSHQNEAPESSTAPVPNSHAPNEGLPHIQPTMVSPKISPTLLAPVASSPSKAPENPPPTHSVLPENPPPSLPEPTTSPVQPPSTRPRGAHIPVAAPTKRTINHHSPVNPLPTKAPSPHGSIRHSDTGPPPLPFARSPVSSEFHSPSYQPPASLRHHHGWNKENTPAPSVYIVSPPSYTEKAPSHHSGTDPKTNLKFHGPPPSNSGSTISPSLAPFPPLKVPDSPMPSQSQQMPFPLPKISPPGSPPRIPKKPLPVPFHALPPPPPNEDCASLTCSEPLTNGPPGSPCVCVIPMQVGLRLSVALYTFFPLVSELAAEIATGVFLKPSQVRIMGANAAGQDPEKTIVLTDLVPLGEKFDNTTAYLTFRRFWHKEVVINTSLFGDYEVLYVHYPGLPPSPPSAPSDISIIDSDPYSGHNYNGAAVKPIGVDVGRTHHKGGPSGSVIAMIVLSTSIAVILCCAVAWVLFFRHRDNLCQQDSTPPVTMPSLAKSSAMAASTMGSGPSSASLSFHSSIAAYTGSAKTFSSSDIEKATDNFSETRILGEGGFGRVYSGVLEDGTNVAVKILKRADQQGGREFLAEVEMLSRLHHRNLVKLIGICTEDRTRCLVYELIPNGSVESHLHGVHKESSPLDWSARMKIALGAARGLAYLHEDSSPRVIHRDFKSSNILLEHDFTPKVSDFGLARTAMEEENRHISTRVMGTFGYVAPEYAMTGHLLVKSDVYSYGVVLLELLTGRKPVDMSQPPGQENLVSWARPLLASEDLESIIDPSLGPNFPSDSISKVAAIASMCVQPEVSHRPFMGEVVQALKLVCNECDETKELGSRSYSQEDFSMDMDARISNTSGILRSPLHDRSPVSNCDCELDVERGYSASELLGSYARQDSGSPRRYSSSGPLRIGKTTQLWQKMRQLSGGSVSEHGLMYSSWRASQ